MCAIAGVVDVVDPSRITDAMLGQMISRGPDGVGICAGERWAIGMRRLRVRGRSELPLPWSLAASGDHVAYNGEVYGVLGKDMPAELPPPEGGPGEVECIFAGSGSDVDGMYAVARMAQGGRRSELRRDRFGIKPLYWRRVGEGFAYASEVVPLAQIGGPPRLREGAVAEMLAFGRTLGPATHYEDIFRVPAGGRVLFENGTARVEIPDGDARRDGEGGDASFLRQGLRESLQRCLIADRPVGLSISGGLDSTILAAELSNLGVEDLTTISVMMEGADDGVEDPAALGLPPGIWRRWHHRSHRIPPEEFPSLLDRSVRLMGEPLRMTSVPLYVRLADLARESDITVLLSGEGADELFGGYHSYREWLAMPDRGGLLDFAFPAGRRTWIERLLGEDAVMWCRDRFTRIYGGLDPTLSGLIEMEYTLSLEPLLHRMDVTLMGRSVEGRVPYLQGWVPTIASSIPVDRLFAPGVTKPVLRDAWRNRFGGALPLREKTPFRAPIATWLRGPLRRWMSRRIEDAADMFGELGFRIEGIRGLLDETLRGSVEASSMVYALLSITYWYEWRYGIRIGNITESGFRQGAECL